MSLRKTAIYIRVSTNDQKTDIQLNEIRSYLSNRHLHDFKIFEDKATGTNNARPQFQALLKAARLREIDVVIVWKLDRFARSLKDLITHLNELSELGIEFISLKDQIDLSTSAGKLMLHIIGAFAQFEADLIRERVRAGIENAKRKGTKLGRPRLSDPVLMSKLRKEGLSLSAIAKQLGVSKTTVHNTLSQISATNSFINPETTESGLKVEKE